VDGRGDWGTHTIDSLMARRLVLDAGHCELC